MNQLTARLICIIHFAYVHLGPIAITAYVNVKTLPWHLIRLSNPTYEVN